MTLGIARRAPDAVEREPGRVRLVLDVEFALDEVVASLLWAELMKEATVDVVLVLPRLSWSSDAALVMSRGRRLAQARQRRIEELARIAGPRAAQLHVSVQRHRWRRPEAPLSLTRPSHRSISQEGPRR
jgi:hypothetical protein